MPEALLEPCLVITKGDYVDTLTALGQHYGMQFPLVFTEARHSQLSDDLLQRLVFRESHLASLLRCAPLAWELNVRLNVEVKRIERHEGSVEVTYRHAMQLLGDETPHAEDRASFDYLIVACPLIHTELEKIVELTEEERWFQSRARYIPYAVASFECADLVLPRRMAFPVPIPPAGRPMLVGQAHRDNELTTFYARLAHDPPTPEDESMLQDHIVQLVTALGGHIDKHDDWHSYDAWLYFKHVDAEQFREGYFDRWEQAQGRNRTFFVGGLFDFDYVEGVVRYSRDLVKRHFVGNR